MPNNVEIEILAKTDQAVAETKKLTDAMRDSSDELVKANQRASESSQSTENQNKKTGFSFTELNSAIGIATQAYGAIKGVLDETYGTYSKNIEAVRDLSLISGTSAEETSRFIQVLDDYQLSAEDAETATKKLKDNGMTPTIDTLAKLADAYKKIEDPAKKMQFVQDNLGKGGAAWVNVLNQTSESLRANAAAQNQNLLFNDQQVKDYEQQRLALDELSDTWEGYKNQVGAAIGNIVLASTEHQKAINILKEQGVVIGRGVENTKAYADALNQVKESEKASADSTAKGTEEYEKQATIMKEAKKAAEELEKSKMSVVQAGISGTVTQSYEKYTDTIQKLGKEHLKLEEDLGHVAWSYGDNTQKVIDLRNKIQDLHDAHAKTDVIDKYEEKLKAIGVVYDESVPKAKELVDKIKENEAAQLSAADAMQTAIDKMIFQQASAGLDSQATLELARAMGMMDEQSYAVATATEALHQQFLTGQLTAEQYAKKVAELRDNVNTLQNKDITISLHTIGLESLAALSDKTQTRSIKGVQQYASGGSFVVPAQYGHEGFPLGNMATASAGEVVTISNPSGGSSAGATSTSTSGSGSTVVNIVLDSATPDPEKVAYNLAPYIKRILRQEGIASAW